MDLLQSVVWNRQSLGSFAPELLLMGSSMLLLLMGAFWPAKRTLAVSIGILSVVGFMALSVPLLSLTGSLSRFSGAITVDSFALFFKFFFGVVTLVTMLFILRSNEFKDISLAEVFAFLLAITMGLSMMAASTDILMMFLSLEIVSVLSYIMVGYKRHNRASSEAGLKYILYGAFASGVMIFGLSYIYGLSGTTDLQGIAQYFHKIEGISSAPVLLFALLCTMIGFAFKIAVFPAQMWCPDVYEGAALPVTAFLSVGPKAAGFAMAIRFFVATIGIREGKPLEIISFIHWDLVIAFMAAITMTLGNLAAISQRNLKRLMAYSSIAHAGYLLLGIAAFSSTGIEALLFYLITYLFMNFGAFFILMLISNKLGTEEIEGFRGLGWRSPVLGACFTIFLFSLTGLPPFAGFVGKLLLFSAIIQKGMYGLATIAALNTVVSLFYYARIVRKMYLEKPLDSTPIVFSKSSVAFTLLFAIPTAVLFLFWDSISKIAEVSVASLFG